MFKNILFATLGILCLLYGTVIMNVRSGTRFFVIWYLLAIFFIGLAAFGFFHVWEKLPSFVYKTIIGIICAAAILLVGTAAVILSQSTTEDVACDAIIVLGAHVRESGPSVVLRYRLDAAVDYLNKYPDTKCIVSGGQGYNEPCTEAEAMYDYLVQQGIAPERIIQEPEATSTLENLEYSKQYCDCENDRVGIVTNGFHSFRSSLLAKKAGYQDVVRIAAGSVPLYLPSNVLRECLAVWKDLLYGNLI